MITAQWFEAAIGGNMKTIHALMSAHAGTSDCYGRTALMLAALYNHIDVVKLLLHKEHGMHDIQCQTALMYAISAGNTEVVRLLLPHEYLIKTGDQKSALYYAIEFEQLDCLEMLLPHLFTDMYRGLRPLALAVFLKCYKAMAYLLQEQNLRYTSLDELTQARDIANATQDAAAFEILETHENMWQMHGKFVSMKLQAEPVATYVPVTYSGPSIFQSATHAQTSGQKSQSQEEQQPIEYLDDCDHETVSAVLSTKERNTRLQSQLSKGIKMVEFKLVNDFLQDIQIDMLGGNTELSSSGASKEDGAPVPPSVQILKSNLPKAVWISYCKQQALRRLRDERLLNEALALVEANKFVPYEAPVLEELRRKRSLISGFLSKEVEELLVSVPDESSSQRGTIESMSMCHDGSAIALVKGGLQAQNIMSCDSGYSYNNKMSKINRINTLGSLDVDRTDWIDESGTENTSVYQ